jgi:hypothetical protein
MNNQRTRRHIERLEKNARWILERIRTGVYQRPDQIEDDLKPLQAGLKHLLTQSELVPA